MSCASTATPTNKLELTLDEPDVASVQRTPCATPKGYRAIALEITPTTWKTDLSKCNVCEARFTWLNHRHKCRKCMEAVCNSCSKGRKALRTYTAAKRICDPCMKNCWTPRDTTATPKKPAAVDAATKPAGKDGRRVSLTVSASDANACPIDATATAPLSPGTPAAAGFFGPGCATPSATAAPAPAEGVAAATNKNITIGTVDTRPPSSSSHRCQVSVAMPSLPLAASAASASPMMMLPPPTPAAAAGGEEEEEAAETMPPSAAGSPSSSFTPPAPFFGGRQGVRRSRRESSGGRLESRVWGGGVALGGEGDVDKAVAAEELQQVETVEAEAAPAAPTGALPALPEEAAAAAASAAVDGDADADAVAAADVEEEEEEDDCGEGGPMMIKIPVWSAVAMSGVAIGTGVVVAVLLRSAFSLVFFY